MSVERLARNGEAHRVTEAEGALEAPPRLHTVVLTCMDARSDPVRVLGFDLGDVHVLRNAGAVVTPDVLRSIMISQQALGTTEIMVVGHTNCGMGSVTEDELRERIVSSTGHEPPMALGTFADVEEHVREGVQRLRGEPLLGATTVARGFVYDVTDGAVREVEVEADRPAHAQR